MNTRTNTLVVVTIAVFALPGCLWWGKAYDGVESCDLVTTFSDSKQNVNCVETGVGTDEYECTCPDGDTFPSSDTCDKSEIDQGELIDTACPETADDEAPTT